MHSPTVQPDEVAQGYAGRLLRLNGCDVPRIWSGQSFARYLASHSPTARVRPWLEALAEPTGLTPENFLRYHTLKPFFNAVMVGDDPRWLLQTHARHLSPSASAPSHFCAECVSEDHSFWGFAYWRRTHQLPGVTRCVKHQTGLWVSKAPGSFLNAPDSQCGNPEPLSDAVVHDAKTNTRIDLYTEICLTLLEGHQPISLDIMVTVLQGQARALGMKRRPGVLGVHISDVAAQWFPGPWQRKYFPDLGNKIRHQYLPFLDRTYSSRNVAYPATAYALALASIFDTADEAMTAIRTEQLDRQQTAKSHSKRSSTLSQVAPEAAITSAWRLFLDGLSVKQACDLHSVDKNDLEALLRSAVVSADKRSDRWTSGRRKKAAIHHPRNDADSVD